MKLILRNFVFLLNLLLLSQFTRFTNELNIEIQPDRTIVRSNLSLMEAVNNFPNVVKITATLQKSTLDESGVANWRISRANEVIQEYNPAAFYLFGKDWLGNMLRGNYREFRPSFGDWTMESARSDELLLYQGAAASPLNVSAEFLGRGVKVLHLYSSNQSKLSIDISDGFIDNALHVCINDECPAGGYTEESKARNILHIINICLECLIAGLLIHTLWLLCLALERRVLKLPEQILELKYSNKSLCCFLAVVHFFITAYFANFILDSTPHIPDSAVYYRQAILLSHGMFSIPDFNFEPLEAVAPNGSFLRNGSLYFHYNHFWPFVLAIGLKLGIVGIFLPLLSSLCLVLVYYIASKLYDSTTGVCAAAFYAVSPFMIIIGGDFMNHTITSAAILGSIALIVSSLNNPSTVKYFFAGFLMAYAFAVRQLTTIGIFLPFFFYLCIFHRPNFLNLKCLWILLGTLIPAVLCLLDNHYLTGHALIFPHSAFHGLSVSWSNLSEGLNYGDSILGYLLPIIFYAPQNYIFMGLVCIPIAAGLNRKDCLLYAIFLTLYCAYLFSNANGLHGYGPRFVYEGLFALFILAARGVMLLWKSNGEIGRSLLGLFLTLVFAWNFYGLYTILPLYENYNGIDTRIFKELKQVSLDKSILTTTNIYWNGLDLGVKFFDPTFNKFIFIKELPDQSHQQIFRNFPGREVFRVDGDRLLKLGIVDADGKI